MALPEEELVRVRGVAASLDLDRRGAARRAAAPPEPLRAPIDPGPFRRQIRADRSRLRLLTPIARGAARAIRPAMSAAKAVGDRLHRSEPTAEDLLAEGVRLEAAGDGVAAFRAFSDALLAAPLDATPVRALERLAAAHDCRLELARVYERVIERVPNHPSAGTLARRAEQLRAMAAARDGAAIPSAETAAATTSFRAAGRRRSAVPVAHDDAQPEAKESASSSPAAAADAHMGSSETDLRSSDGPTSATRLAEEGEATPPASGSRRAAAAASPTAGGGDSRLRERASGAPPDPSDARSFACSQPFVAPFAAPRATNADPGNERGLGVLREGSRSDSGCRGPVLESADDPSFAARQVPLFERASTSSDVPLGARLLAWAIDGAIVSLVPLVSVAAAVAAAAPDGLNWTDRILEWLNGGGAPVSAAFLLVLTTAFVYLTLGTAIGGGTVGDRIAGLRAVDPDSGGAPDLPKAALRSLFAIAGTLAFLAGPLWAFVDPAGQTLHDRVAGTRIRRNEATTR